MEEKKAGFILRVTALTIDEIILVSATFILIQFIKWVINEEITHSLLFIILFYELLDYNYYTLFWVFGGQTPGKMLMKTKLVKMNGSRFTYKDSFIRYWTWMVGVALLGVGYFWIAWNKNKQGWNDITAKTYVIRVQ
ncbi:MAG: RDD family protein [Bacillota bacterium]|nr:RDD family protein [Bacillota bacterium]